MWTLSFLSYWFIHVPCTNSSIYLHIVPNYIVNLLYLMYIIFHELNFFIITVDLIKCFFKLPISVLTYIPSNKVVNLMFWNVALH